MHPDSAERHGFRLLTYGKIYTEKLPFPDLSEAQVILQPAHGGLPARPYDRIILKRGLDDRTWTVMTDCWIFKAYNRPDMQDVMARREFKDGDPRPCTETFEDGTLRL
jgi:hypothetical protein